MRQRKVQRYDPVSQSYRTHTIFEPEPEPEPSPSSWEELPLDLTAAAAPAEGGAGAPDRPRLPGAAPPGEEERPPPTDPKPPAEASRRPKAPPPLPIETTEVPTAPIVAVVALLVVLACWSSGGIGKLGQALRRAHAGAHDGHAVCGLDLAEQLELSQGDPPPPDGLPPPAGPVEASAPAAEGGGPVVDGVLCVDDPKKELLGSDCTAYALHPGCDQDLHALYDGALYGKEYSGRTVADLCPRACKVCT